MTTIAITTSDRVCRVSMIDNRNTSRIPLAPKKILGQPRCMAFPRIGSPRGVKRGKDGIAVFLRVSIDILGLAVLLTDPLLFGALYA
jgi:hypothetical protein